MRPRDASTHARHPAVVFANILVVSLCLAPTWPVRIRVLDPAPYAIVSGAEAFVTVRGSARGAPGRTPPIDLVLALDVSHSTRLASGTDVDGDGETGRVLGRLPSTDPDDSLLHAEVAAARALLEGLPATGVRVGLVTFSGESDRRTGFQQRPDQANAWLRAPVLPGGSAIPDALDRVLEEGSHGATDFEAGIRVATGALLAAEDSEGVRRAILFLSDGLPTFPVGRADVSDPGDRERARAAAIDAEAAGVRIHVFALGPDALARPEAATELARLTGGSFTALPEPAAVVGLLGELRLEGAERVRVTNLGTGLPADELDVRPDGGFEARVPVIEGANRIRVAAGVPPVHVDVPIEFRLERGQAADPEQRRSLEIRVLDADTEGADPES